MPRSPRQICSELPYHIRARSNNRDWFQLSISEVWKIYSDYLYLIHHAYGIRIQSFVLMNNHFHLLARSPNGNLSEAMNYFMRETSRVIGFETNRINQIYGGPFRSTLIDTQHYYAHAYKYIYRNPIDAGLCEMVEDYRWSTLNGLVGRSRVTIPLDADTFLFGPSSVNQTLTWLNTSYQDDDREQIKRAMQKRVFRIAKHATTKRKSHLETDLS